MILLLAHPEEGPAHPLRSQNLQAFPVSSGFFVKSAFQLVMQSFEQDPVATLFMNDNSIFSKASKTSSVLMLHKYCVHL